MTPLSMPVTKPTRPTAHLRGLRRAGLLSALALLALTPLERAAGASLLDAATDRFPAANARGVCADLSLRLRFPAPVQVGARGVIRVFRDGNTPALVASIDVAAPEFRDVIAGREFRQNRPIFMDGSEASIYLPQRALAGNETYFATIDPGVFVDAAGRALPGVAAGEWRFSTRSTQAARADRMVVSRDDGGDFCSVQGAIEAVPAGNTTPTTIELRNGIYHEIVFINGKSNVTLHGEDRAQTQIVYSNNDTLQAGGGTKVRAMVEVEQSTDIAFENLTLHNTTPQGGSQAESLRVGQGDRIILRNATFKSLQDTVMLTGRVFVVDSYIEGNVDFVWGGGSAYFQNSEIRTVGRAGFIVQARNDTNPGFVFVDSKLTADPDIRGSLLARIEIDRFPRSEVAFIECQVGEHIDPRGWQIRNAMPGDGRDLHFFEFRNTDLRGRPLDVSQRDPLSRQISAAEAARLRDKRNVLGGWNPS